MRQIFGYLLILCSIPLLLLIGSEVWKELAKAQQHEQSIEQSIELPEVATSRLPVSLYDANNNVFSEEYTEFHQPMTIDAIPEFVKQLFLYSEDENFYEHIGFDVSAIARAFIANTSEQGIQQGGSTITQQLVRMRYLSVEKTYERKLMELFYAYELEQKYSKEQILEMYLNEMYFNNQVYGIGAAASYYFNRSLSELSLAEIAFIAAIPNNPSLYDPLKNFDNTKSRQERLIDKLVEHQAISQAEATAHKNEEIHLAVKAKVQQYPSYSTYVLQELKWLIAEQSGYAKKIATTTDKMEKEVLQLELDKEVERVMNQGIHVYTALQPEKQVKDESAINRILTTPELQASATVIDNNTREIVSIFGGKDYQKYDLHRAFQSPRQPGSSFKPISVYAPYFETTTASKNAIVSGGRYCVGIFCPENYGGYEYGNVTIETAFKHSYNTSALRLYEQIGVDTAFSYIDRFQFKSIIDKDRTYAAALGGLTYGVTTLEMADAYSSFIDGFYTPARSIRKVTNLNGETLYSWAKDQQEFWSSSTVKTMRDLLNSVVRSGTGGGLYSRSGYIGAKTGTTNQYKDYWVAGLTNDYTAAVWIGYDKPTSMERIEKAKIHFSIFNAITD
ncbi:penicillin-binding protein [Lysinibacillus sp. 2017]|uniref:transglycosylase domain-containing protein n=1 Tax=unclassified Lysinibacillus TaxID=2636778 RepID=UPI000D5278B4|nr:MULTISPECIES: transglycosylase domain-containing protein [unclassified Lysinibacillus]AWE08433.1 penicillin-binding protein [Lysinibacillus sp. 2017]TGN34922.1 penicillin-binding protein [Lysinibacillus sp. S2017]